jgi:hypothetical protein
MKAEQKRLEFRSSVAAANELFFSVMVMETGPNRYSVANFFPESYYAVNSSANIAAWNSFYSLISNTFKIGAEYKKQEFIDWADTNDYSLIETSQENAAGQVFTLDIGSVASLSAGTPNATDATITWSNTGATKNTKINVYLSDDDGVTYTFVSSVAANATTSGAITGLTTATAYKVKITPANAYGEGTGVEVSFTTA